MRKMLLVLFSQCAATNVGDDLHTKSKDEELMLRSLAVGKEEVRILPFHL